jgi:hypothetical protein
MLSILLAPQGRRFFLFTYVVYFAFSTRQRQQSGQLVRKKKWSATQYTLTYSITWMINEIIFYMKKRILQSTGYKFADATPDAITMI